MFDQNELKKIKSLSKKMEESQSILPEVLEMIYKRKLFKIFTPKTLGGLELSFIDGLKVFQQVGSIDGNIGWAVTIGTGGNMFIPLFNRELCERHFLQKEAVIAGSGKFGIAERVEGGFIISGEWKYCSGADYATLFTMNCQIRESNENVTCSVPRENVKILPNWNAMGLKATSSHSMKVESVFVKDEETFTFGRFQNEFELPVHSFPFIPFSKASFFSLCLGLTEQLLSEACEALNRKKDHIVIERYELVKEKWIQAIEVTKNIEQQFYSLVLGLWEKHINGKLLSGEELNHFSMFCQVQSNELLMLAHSLMRYYGMEAVLEHTDLNRAWRNLCTASQHVFLTP
nr:acyl-CoA dehydrogenase [Lysinibacillus timonensis]